jgi:hypothetical protein
MDDDDDLDDDDDMLERGWPDRAYHSETSFGYPLDSGDHHICASPTPAAQRAGIDVSTLQTGTTSRWSRTRVSCPSMGRRARAAEAGGDGGFGCS